MTVELNFIIDFLQELFFPQVPVINELFDNLFNNIIKKEKENFSRYLFPKLKHKVSIYFSFDIFFLQKYT